LGDSNFAKTSATFTLVETGYNSTGVTVTANPYPAHAESTVTLTALVSDTAGFGEAPTGTVTFYNGQPGSYPNQSGSGVQIGSPVTLTAGTDSATGSLTTTFPTAGLYTIYAVYSGDINYETSTASVNEAIQGPGPDRKTR
jgi:hypothetical protein